MGLVLHNLDFLIVPVIITVIGFLFPFININNYFI